MLTSVLFICSQNTCRSAAAEAVFLYLIKETQADVAVDSAGIHALDGIPPTEKIRQAGALRGYDLSSLRSRVVAADDFARFDYLIAMDETNMEALRQQAPTEHAHKIHLCGEYASFFEQGEILYPASNEVAAFSKLFDRIEDACLGLFHHVRSDRKSDC